MGDVLGELEATVVELRAKVARARRLAFSQTAKDVIATLNDYADMLEKDALASEQRAIELRHDLAHAQ